MKLVHAFCALAAIILPSLLDAGEARADCDTSIAEWNRNAVKQRDLAQKYRVIAMDRSKAAEQCRLARDLVQVRETYVRLHPSLANCKLDGPQLLPLERAEENLKRAIEMRHEECAKAPAPRPSAKGGCAVQGASIPINCSNESSGKNCRCLNIANRCGYPITVTYKATGATAGSTDLENEETLTNACTGQRSQSIQFLGYRRRK